MEATLEDEVVDPSSGGMGRRLNTARLIFTSAVYAHRRTTGISQLRPMSAPKSSIAVPDMTDHTALYS